ncbi:hypothetical protein KXW02_002306 [Aspergillus fumigatus]|nr:hypothetical protein KXW02_002306 [Aspergillus fumigatus]
MAILTPSNTGAQQELLTSERARCVDFITRRPELSLGSLKSADISVPEILIALDNYRTVLQQGGSIALGRGESLASVRLDRSFSGLFSTEAPKVIQGPAITWTALVLSAGPRFDGASQFKVGESLVEVVGDDLELICSGRPWRFLSPWPDREDCEAELRSTETALRELLDTKLLMRQVLEKTASLENGLRSRQRLIDQLRSGDQRPTPITAGAGSATVHSKASSDCSSHEAFAVTTVNEVPQANSTGTVSNISGPGEAGSQSFVGLDSPRIPGAAMTPESVQAGGPQLDFILNLHDILNEPSSNAAMHWSRDGRSFSLAEESEFPDHLLSRLSVVSYSSLIRRLYYYGFHKSRGSYYHERFIRGQPCPIRPGRAKSHDYLPSANSACRPRVKYIRRRRQREKANV